MRRPAKGGKAEKVLVGEAGPELRLPNTFNYNVGANIPWVSNNALNSAANWTTTAASPSNYYNAATTMATTGVG